MKLLPLVAVFFFSACSLDRQFLAPQKIPPTAKRGRSISPITGDTVTLQIGEKFQPTFLDNAGKEISQQYTIESVLFQSSSGNMLNGWFMKPTPSTAIKSTILFFHGNGGNITTEYVALAPLVERGFQGLIIDYSGYGFSTGKATRDNVKKDGQSALDYLLTRSDVKGTRKIIYGQSLGGNLAAVIAAEHQASIDGLVIEGAFSSHKDVASYTSGMSGIARLFVAEKYSATDAISRYQKPLLVIHSRDDETIPIVLGRKIYANANTPKEFYEIGKCHACGPAHYADSISLKLQRMTGL